MRIIYLFSLEEKLESNMEKNMERTAKLIENPEGKIPKGDDVDQTSQEDKYSVHVYQPSINKNTTIGFDSNNGSNHGWSQRDIQRPNIYMRKFDGKDLITWMS